MIVLLQIVSFCSINGVVDFHNFSVLIHFFVVTIENFIMEIISSTFVRIIIVTNFVISFDAVGAKSLRFLERVEVFYKVHFNIVVIIHFELFHIY